jgi:hypothetical protein
VRSSRHILEPAGATTFSIELIKAPGKFASSGRMPHYGYQLMRLAPAVLARASQWDECDSRDVSMAVWSLGARA